MDDPEEARADYLRDLAVRAKKTWEAFFGDAPCDSHWAAHFAGQFYEDLTKEEVDELARRICDSPGEASDTSERNAGS